MVRSKLLLLQILCILFGLGIYISCDFTLLGLRRNISDSLPYSFFVASTVSDIQSGLYVSIKHPLSSINLVKQIGGIPGDEIKIENQHVLINGKNCGRILEKGRSGKSLTPIKEGRIPTEYFFVCASHPESFDSRYAEFGLIHRQQIEERLCPLF